MQIVLAVVSAIVVALSGMSTQALAVALGVLTVIVVIVMAPVTLIAYRDRRNRT
jgi:hypothetical protein